MKINFRSSCPIASVLDLLGDKWSLLIIRDMLMIRKKTFKEIYASDEGIATNTLSSRLKLLESVKLITKRKLPTNKKENIYLLTDKAISLAPLIVETILWSDQYVRADNPAMFDLAERGLDADKNVLIETVQKNYRAMRKEIIG